MMIDDKKLKIDGEFKTTGVTITMLPASAELGVEIKVRSCNGGPVNNVRCPPSVKAIYLEEEIDARWVMIREGMDYKAYRIEAND